MRLVGNPNSEVDRYDRAVWLTVPFDVYLGVPSVPGLEFTLPENRMHFVLPDNLPHATLPENRMHFVIPEEDDV